MKYLTFFRAGDIHMELDIKIENDSLSIPLKDPFHLELDSIVDQI